MKKVKCSTCGNYFMTEAKNAKYCCLACRVEGSGKKRAEWRAKNVERIKKTNAIYWKKRSARLAKAKNQ